MSYDEYKYDDTSDNEEDIEETDEDIGPTEVAGNEEDNVYAEEDDKTEPKNWDDYAEEELEKLTDEELEEIMESTHEEIKEMESVEGEKQSNEPTLVKGYHKKIKQGGLDYKVSAGKKEGLDRVIGDDVILG